MWIVSNVLIGFVVARGAALWVITGVLMITADVVYDTLQPIQPLQIPFKDGSLTFHYDWCFWLQILSGILPHIYLPGTLLAANIIRYFAHLYLPGILLASDIITYFAQLYLPGTLLASDIITYFAPCILTR